MHHVIERFVGRYEVWRRSVPLRNPLNIPALVLATSVAQAVYQIATSHQLAWGAMALIQLPFALASGFHGYPFRVRLVATRLLLFVGVGFIAWGFAIRQ